MNRTLIEWADWTWNPITGCENTCNYCYARNQARRFKWSFKPAFHLERLLEPLSRRKPCTIFTCSMGEFFSPKIDDLQRNLVLEVIRHCPEHIFVILTKRPDEMRRYFPGPYSTPSVPHNLWLGVSADRARTFWGLDDIAGLCAPTRILCLEPLLEDLSPLLINAALNYCRSRLGEPRTFPVDWVIIGGCSRPQTFRPPAAWITRIVALCGAFGVPVFVKPNAGYISRVRERPGKDSWDRKICRPDRAALEQLRVMGLEALKDGLETKP